MPEVPEIEGEIRSRRSFFKALAVALSALALMESNNSVHVFRDGG